MKSCRTAAFCLCRPKSSLGAGPGHSAGTLPRKLRKVFQTPPHWLTWNSGCQGWLHHLQVPVQDENQSHLPMGLPPQAMVEVALPRDHNLHPRICWVPGLGWVRGNQGIPLIEHEPPHPSPLSKQPGCCSGRRAAGGARGQGGSRRRDHHCSEASSPRA